MTLKKGDKVRITRAYPSRHNGEIATFIGGGPSSDCDVLLENGCRWCCHEVEPLVDKREQAIYKRICNIKRPKPRGFRVGDKVKCISADKIVIGDDRHIFDTPYNSSICIGRITKIIELGCNYIKIECVVGMGGGEDLKYDPKGFELVVKE